MDNLPGHFFFAISMPDEVRKFLGPQTAKILMPLKKEHIAPKTKWHTTLTFLGPLTQVHIDQLQSYFSKIPLPCFDLSFGSLGAFPDEEKARVLWAGIDQGANELIAIAEYLRVQLKILDIPFDNKPFIPHMTLCRMRGRRNLGKFMASPFPKGTMTFKITTIGLYQTLGRQFPYKLWQEIELA